MDTMELDKILEEWKTDSEINGKYGHTIVSASQNSSRLHAKYIDLYAKAKLKLKQAEFEQKKLMKLKWLWYNGKMDQQQIDKLGWDPDPFDGLKVLKGDMQHYVEADPELIESEAKIEYLKTIVETLKEILDNIRWRHQNIRNIIDIKKFEAGH